MRTYSTACEHTNLMHPTCTSLIMSWVVFTTRQHLTMSVNLLKSPEYARCACGKAVRGNRNINRRFDFQIHRNEAEAGSFGNLSALITHTKKREPWQWRDQYASEALECVFPRHRLELILLRFDVDYFRIPSLCFQF